MQLWEIALAFNKCTGDEIKSFKNYFHDLYLSNSELDNGVVVKGSYNFILSDVEKLITKIISNLISSFLLNKEGMISWGYVTAYYANYFSFQALNRLHLNFISYSESLYSCTFINYINNELLVKKSDTSKTHIREYQLYAEKRNKMSLESSPDRLWSIANSRFTFGDEVNLRNEINYSISQDNFSEFLMTKTEFDQLKSHYKNSPFIKPLDLDKEFRYSYESMKYGLSRLRVIMYILNKIANESNLYSSYYIRRNNHRLRSIEENFKNELPMWMVQYFNEILIFLEMDKEEKILPSEVKN
ncbi:hypothetical protein [Leptospira weilii]|uniref:hypothetical protein n=1 Tax=Leptospira weilii TaxID=28184 RepID=UPI001EF19244|nr:hypothetical protein [Leptospira weilii]ULH30888.1 hypothetical protein FH586_22440 [Leptospira weilii]